MKKLLSALLIVMMCFCMFACGAEEPAGDEGGDAAVEPKGTLLMATTTSTDNTGLLDYLAPIFAEDTGWTLEWSAVGTGEALKMGENGDVDIVLVHAKASEEEFVANGFGVERVPVMYNDFVLVGPEAEDAYGDDLESCLKAIVWATMERPSHWPSWTVSCHSYPEVMTPVPIRQKRSCGRHLNWTQL